ncbi:hypothetical protein ACFLRA_00735 [Bdellovibrionota bacterium]
MRRTLVFFLFFFLALPLTFQNLCFSAPERETARALLPDINPWSKTSSTSTVRAMTPGEMEAQWAKEEKEKRDLAEHWDAVFKAWGEEHGLSLEEAKKKKIPQDEILEIIKKLVEEKDNEDPDDFHRRFPNSPKISAYVDPFSSSLSVLIGDHSENGTPDLPGTDPSADEIQLTDLTGSDSDYVSTDGEIYQEDRPKGDTSDDSMYPDGYDGTMIHPSGSIEYSGVESSGNDREHLLAGAISSADGVTLLGASDQNTDEGILGPYSEVGNGDGEDDEDDADDDDEEGDEGDQDGKKIYILVIHGPDEGDHTTAVANNTQKLFKGRGSKVRMAQNTEQAKEGLDEIKKEIKAGNVSQVIVFVFAHGLKDNERYTYVLHGEEVPQDFVDGDLAEMGSEVPTTKFTTSCFDSSHRNESSSYEVITGAGETVPGWMGGVPAQIIYNAVLINGGNPERGDWGDYRPPIFDANGDGVGTFVEGFITLILSILGSEERIYTKINRERGIEVNNELDVLGEMEKTGAKFPTDAEYNRIKREKTWNGPTPKRPSKLLKRLSSIKRDILEGENDYEYRRKRCSLWIQKAHALLLWYYLQTGQLDKIPGALLIQIIQP